MEEMEKTHGRDVVLVLDQKSLDWLIKILFLREAETAIRSGIKSRFGLTGTSDAILGDFCFNN